MHDSIKNKALKLGASEIGNSNMKNKRLYVIYKNKIIHFGSKNGQTYYDHKDKNKRNAWIARHSKIKNKHGEYVIYDKMSPSFWSAKILW